MVHVLRHLPCIDLLYGCTKQSGVSSWQSVAVSTQAAVDVMATIVVIAGPGAAVVVAAAVVVVVAAAAQLEHSDFNEGQGLACSTSLWETISSRFIKIRKEAPYMINKANRTADRPSTLSNSDHLAQRIILKLEYGVLGPCCRPP
ncbi:unnamed protein product [Toxocara canis]|uniref:Uncharacterized protein n=1 Tax=Toxocara canis TaxID=6265 RepID=A0A183U0W8_TOXCA|nr:unnamed protein product [Toxocara canis]